MCAMVKLQGKYMGYVMAIQRLMALNIFKGGVTMPQNGYNIKSKCRPRNHVVVIQLYPKWVKAKQAKLSFVPQGIFVTVTRNIRTDFSKQKSSETWDLTRQQSGKQKHGILTQPKVHLKCCAQPRCFSARQCYGYAHLWLLWTLKIIGSWTILLVLSREWGNDP